MLRKPSGKKKIDVIDKVLNACYQYNKDALFVMSLMHQYEERGSLSRKQLEGLVLKARKVPDLPAGWIGAIEAIILKMPVRDKTPVAEQQAPQNDHSLVQQQQITEILQKYPEHKRILFMQSKLTGREQLNTTESAELERLYRLLISKAK
jgi:hypothetical protein